ncbi:MAG: hypothetical protein Kow00128_08230 [Deltaproteobacteria bacterium]
MPEHGDRLRGEPALLVENGGPGQLVDPLHDLPLAEEKESELLADLGILRGLLDLPGEGAAVFLRAGGEELPDRIPDSHA